MRNNRILLATSTAYSGGGTDQTLVVPQPGILKWIDFGLCASCQEIAVADRDCRALVWLGSPSLGLADAISSGPRYSNLIAGAVGLFRSNAGTGQSIPLQKFCSELNIKVTNRDVLTVQLIADAGVTFLGTIVCCIEV